MSWQTEPLGTSLLRKIKEYVDSLKNRPDPWEAEDAAAVQTEEATPICPHCILPVNPEDHFCPRCNKAVGDYNNVMPFERLYSYGEVMRNGVEEEAHLTPYRTTAFAMISLVAMGPFAPLYWIRLYRNRKRGRSETN